MPSLSLSPKLSSAKRLRISSSPITYLGRENETSAGNFAVSKWADSSAPKKFSAVNRYGTSGFYQIRIGNSDLYESAPSPNDLGINAAIQPTLYQEPSFANVTGFDGTYVNFGGYPILSSPFGLEPYRTGALSVPVNTGPHNSPSGTDKSFFGEAFKIEMTEDKDFLLGVAVDTAGANIYAPKYVSVFLADVGTIFSTAIPTAGATASIPRLPVFSIKGKTGDQFIIGLWHDGIDSNSDGIMDVSVMPVAPFSLITFD